MQAEGETPTTSSRLCRQKILQYHDIELFCPISISIVCMFDLKKKQAVDSFWKNYVNGIEIHLMKQLRQDIDISLCCHKKYIYYIT